MFYKVHFYRSPEPNGHPFATPTQVFQSLDEALKFAQDAADAALVELAQSFRIESEDGKVHERWGRVSGGWKLLI